MNFETMDSVHFNKNIHFPIIGIGGSAGGLLPLEDIIKELPADFCAAVIIIQHLPANTKTLLPGILKAKFPQHEYIEIRNAMLIEAGKVYVNPPGNDVILKDDHFTIKPSPKETIHFPIDTFFFSLAEVAGENGVAVILSGAGTDGTRGIREVHSNNGTVVVQDPNTAEFRSMPDVAIASFVVDAILSPENIGRHLISLVETINKHAVVFDKNGRESLDALFNLIYDKSGFRFEDYKKSVIVRRMQRRISLLGVASLEEYKNLLNKNPTEIARLATDLMIGVTAFFRDPAAWDLLKNLVVSNLIADKKNSESLRVWTPGCSTGEEAYSITMLLLQEIEAAGKRFDIQVFASDINEASLAFAREGKYPSSVSADIPAEYKKKYFTGSEDGLYVQISKQVRDHVVFAKQNVLTDPPFSKLDLIICRNLLIYFTTDAQDKCISIFHYALRDNRYLFQGNSESLGRNKAFFVPVGDKNSRIYQRIAQTLPIRYNFPTTMPMNILKNNGADDISLTADWDITEFAHNTLLSLFAPAAILINDRYEILYFNGPVRKFIAPPSGQISMDFVSWLPEALRNKMRGTLYNASQSEKKVSAQVVMPDVNGKEHSIVLSIQRHKHPMNAANIYLVTFLEHAARLSEETVVIQGTEADQAAILQLERELNITREAMQTNTEELQSANEELKSANEELQASNEEMDTSREELQSLNEELSSINVQLQTALEQQDATNNDLHNFMSSTNIPTLFLDVSFNVKRYTPAMTNLIKLLPTDIGRPLFDMSYVNLGPRITEVAESVLKNLIPVKEEIRIGTIWYQRSILPYRTADNRIEGVVISYIDINERRKMEEEIQLLARFPAENPSPILRISKDGIVLYANAAGGPLLNKWNCTTHCSASDDIRTMIAQTFDEKQPKNVEIECNDRIFAFDVVPLIDAGYVNMYGKDITLRRQTENNLQESQQRNEFLANVIEFSTQPFGVGYPDGRLGLINKAFEELTGYSSKELHALDWAKVLTPPEWVDSETQKLTELQATGIPVRYEKEYIRKNGTRVPIDLLVHIKKDAQGKPLYYYSFVTDISERKKAEEELRESRYRIEAIFATIPDLIVEYDAKGVLVRTNKAELVVTGLNPLNLTTEQVSNAAQILKLDGKPLSVKDTPTVRALQGEIIQNEQYAIKNADGTERVVTTFAAPLYKNGMVSGVVAFLHDITNIKRAEEALRESENRYHGLFNTMEEGFCIIEMVFDAQNKPADYRFLEVNAAFDAQTGLHEASGKLMRELVPAHEDFWFEIFGNIALSGEPARFVNEAAALNRWFQVTAYRVGKPEKRQVAIIFSDISEIKKAEIRLRESNAEMERFNRAAIDREIRMIELKKENNALRELAGQKPLYPLDFEKEQL